MAEEFQLDRQCSFGDFVILGLSRRLIPCIYRTLHRSPDPFRSNFCGFRRPIDRFYTIFEKIPKKVMDIRMSTKQKQKEQKISILNNIITLKNKENEKPN